MVSMVEESVDDRPARDESHQQSVPQRGDG